MRLLGPLLKFWDLFFIRQFLKLESDVRYILVMDSLITKIIDELNKSLNKANTTETTTLFET